MNKEQSIRRVGRENQKTIGKEVNKNMKDRKNIEWRGYWLITMILAIALTMLMTPMPALAVDCTAPTTADFDMDGFTDQQECANLMLYDGVTIIPGALQAAVPRGERLDPNSKDVFVILALASTSNVPANPLQYVIAPQAAGGLPVITHVLVPGQADVTRMVSPSATQKALKIAENLDTSATDVLGIANYGTPNGLDLATIYTARIKAHVNSVCTASITSCNDADGITIGAANVIDKYIRHTIAHEVAHNMVLTDTYNDRFGGYHYKSGTNTVLDQSVYYTSKSGKVTWYIGSSFTPADQAVVRLQ